MMYVRWALPGRVAGGLAAVLMLASCSGPDLLDGLDLGLGPDLLQPDVQAEPPADLPGDTVDGVGDARDAGDPDAADLSRLPPGVLGPYPLTTCDRLQYAVQTTVGGQTFNLSIDTGSASLAVAAASCANCTDTVNLYEPGDAALDLERSTSITYADGSGWTGEIYNDAVQLTGMTEPVSMNFVAIQDHRRFLRPPATCSDGSTYIDDGILGLGPEGSGAQGTDDFVTRLARSYPGVGSAFAFQLCPTGGQMWVGGFDPAATAAPMEYVPMLPVDENLPFYAVSIDDMALGGQSLGLGPNDFGVSLVDSGTTLFYLPDGAFTTLTTRLLADPTFQQMVTTNPAFFNEFACLKSSASVEELDAALPRVKITLPSRTGGKGVVLDLPAFNSYLTMANTGAGLALCAGVSNGGGTTIIGDVVLSALVTLIDRQVNLVGFAPQKGCTP